MATTAERAKQVFGQVLAQGRGQVDDVRQRRHRAHLITELGELSYRRAEGESGLDDEMERLIETIRALEADPDSVGPQIEEPVEKSHAAEEE